MFLTEHLTLLITGGDGVELCSTAHLTVAGGNYANELSTAADLERNIIRAVIN